MKKHDLQSLVKQSSAPVQEPVDGPSRDSVALQTINEAVEYGRQDYLKKMSAQQRELGVLSAQVAGAVARAEFIRIKQSTAAGTCWKCHVHPAHPASHLNLCANCT